MAISKENLQKFKLIHNFPDQLYLKNHLINVQNLEVKIPGLRNTWETIEGKLVDYGFQKPGFIHDNKTVKETIIMIPNFSIYCDEANDLLWMPFEKFNKFYSVYYYYHYYWYFITKKSYSYAFFNYLKNVQLEDMFLSPKHFGFTYHTFSLNKKKK